MQPNDNEDEKTSAINLGHPRVQLFLDGCFGHVFNMEHEDTLARILHSFILRLIHIRENELCFCINGKMLYFGCKEFAIITGLKCDPLPILKFKNIEGPNILKVQFFHEDNKVITPAPGVISLWYFSEELYDVL